MENRLSIQMELGMQEVRVCNAYSGQFGLVLNEPEIRGLVECRHKVLVETGRAEFGGGILPKLIHADSEILCLQMGICESLLESGRKPGADTLDNKRETRTSRILQSVRQVRVPALMRLNRRVQNRTHGGVRGRG